MQKGSLVRIKKSGDKKLIGSCGIALREHSDGWVVIHRLTDGRKDSYHKTSLEVLA
jgi:hypothetical protein